MEPVDYRHCVPMGLKALLLTAAGLIAAAASLVVAEAQPRRTSAPMEPADILQIANVSDAQISPNGQWVVYTVATVEGEQTISTLWLARVGLNVGSGSMSAPPQSTNSRLLDGNWNASNPRWSPDSAKIAFISEHNSQRSLWVVTLENREPRFIVALQNTNFFITYAGESIAWAPDSSQIAYVSATEDSTDSGSSTASRIVSVGQCRVKPHFAERSPILRSAFPVRWPS